MANLSNLLAHIARFLKELANKFLAILGLVDLTKNELDAASVAQSEAAG